MYMESDASNDNNNDNSEMYNRQTEILSHHTVDLRQLLKDKINKNELFYSFELVSTKKPNSFYQRLLTGMERYLPLFYALTWHDEAVSVEDSYRPLMLANIFPRNTLLHLAAENLNRKEVTDILEKALAYGIKNIFALQGDSSSKKGNFEHAVDLVTFIREQFGNTFCICVAGYPQTHPKAFSKESDLYYLKAKIEAGADFIITQMFFESQIFIDFVKDCRKIGIQVPIIPGILVPSTYECLEKMTHICKLSIPSDIEHDLARIRNNDRATKKFIVELTVRMIAEIIESGTTCGFHLFTLNRLELVSEICERINFRQMTSI